MFNVFLNFSLMGRQGVIRHLIISHFQTNLVMKGITLPPLTIENRSHLFMLFYSKRETATGYIRFPVSALPQQKKCPVYVLFLYIYIPK